MSQAHAVLNQFLQSQVDEAMDLAGKLIHKIQMETAALLLPDIPGSAG